MPQGRGLGDRSFIAVDYKPLNILKLSVNGYLLDGNVTTLPARISGTLIWSANIQCSKSPYVFSSRTKKHSCDDPEIEFLYGRRGKRIPIESPFKLSKFYHLYNKMLIITEMYYFY